MQYTTAPEIQGFFSLCAELRERAAESPLRSLLERLHRRLREFSGAGDESFLCGASDHADLERRIHALERSRCRGLLDPR